jgi:hypothetical protein
MTVHDSFIVGGVYFAIDKNSNYRKNLGFYCKFTSNDSKTLVMKIINYYLTDSGCLQTPLSHASVYH